MSNLPVQSGGDPLDRIVDAFVGQSCPEGPDDQVKRRLLVAMEQLAGESEDPPPVLAIRNSHMRRFARVAVAAVVLAIAVFGAVELTSNNGHSPGSAFAAMIQRVQQVRSASFKLVMQVKDGPSVEIENLVLEPGLHRQSINGDETEFIQIFNLNEGKALSLFVKHKQAQLVEITNEPLKREQTNFVDEFRRMTSEGAVYEGRENVGDVDALKYRYDKSGDHYVIWLDPSTNLPVQVAATDVAKGEEARTSMTMTDFQWDVEVDESLFSLEIPEGYSLSPEVALDAGMWNEENFVELMRVLCRLNDGQFPDELNAMALVSTLTRDAASDEITGAEKRRRLGEAFGHPELADMPESNRMQFVLDVIVPVFGGGAGFMEVTKQTHEWHYLGKGVQLDDADAVVVWWHPTAEAAESDDQLDSNVAKVMFGDLRIEEMPVEDVPQREQLP